MLKIKLLSAIIGLTLISGTLSACSSNQQAAKPTNSEPQTTKQADTSGKLTDGTYKVEYDNFDSHDYKGQLELTVSGGKITAVKYDEVKKDGTLKSQDTQYKTQMEKTSKTYPEKAYGELKQQLITKQTADLDVVTGATASSNNFKGLVKYAIDEMAKKGVTTPAKIPAAKQ